MNNNNDSYGSYDELAAAIRSVIDQIEQPVLVPIEWAGTPECIAGYRARKRGNSMGANPYSVFSDAYDKWHLGWMAAYKEERAREMF